MAPQLHGIGAKVAHMHSMMRAGWAMTDGDTGMMWRRHRVPRDKPAHARYVAVLVPQSNGAIVSGVTTHERDVYIVAKCVGEYCCDGAGTCRRVRFTFLDV